MTLIRRVQNAYRAFKAAPTTTQSLGPFKIGRDAPKDWDVTRAITEGYKASEIVNRCVDFRAQAIGSVPWYVEQIDAQGEWERVPGHPLEMLLERPNPAMRRRRLAEYMSKHLDLGGNAIWTMVSATDFTLGRKVPMELWPLNPAGVTAIAGDGAKNKLIAQYRYRLDGYEKVFSADEVIHFLYPDPGNFLWGQGILQALARTVDTQVAAQKWNLSSFSSRAIPDGMVSFDRPINRDDYEQIRKEWESEQAGADNARRVLIMGDGASYEMLSWKPTEMDFIDGLKLNREHIISAFGLMPPVLGFMENATLANLVESRRLVWEDTIIPALDAIADTFNQVLMPLFGDPDQFRVCYDVSKVPALRPDLGAKVTQVKELWTCGTPLNVAIRWSQLDIEDVDGGDIGFVPSTVIPATMAGEMAQQQIRMGDATIENTDANTQATLKPPKDPNKTPKPTLGA